jgi:hypothetical protein
MTFRMHQRSSSPKLKIEATGPPKNNTTLSFNLTASIPKHRHLLFLQPTQSHAANRNPLPFPPQGYKVHWVGWELGEFPFNLGRTKSTNQPTFIMKIISEFLISFNPKLIVLQIQFLSQIYQ